MSLRNGLAHMQTAFLALRVFPPPASGTDVLPGVIARVRVHSQYWGKAVMQLVIGHIILPQILPHFSIAPVKQRIEFLQSIGDPASIAARIRERCIVPPHAVIRARFPDGHAQQFHREYGNSLRNSALP